MRNLARGRLETWVVIADGSRARVCQVRDGGNSLVPAWEFQPVGSNLPSREIASDRPGRTFDRAGTGRHAKEPPTDPARYEKERFAREIIQKLHDHRKRLAFDQLIVVAPPEFLGDLRAAMPAQLKSCVKAEVRKDLSKCKLEEIRGRLERLF